MMPLAFLREPLIEKLGWALVHFLWEGALIALLFGVANAALRRASANARYLLACGALALMVVSVAATFWRLDSAGAARVPLAAPAVVAVAPEAAAATLAKSMVAARFEAEVAAYVPWLVCAWLAGVMALSIRSAGGWLMARRLAVWDVVPAEPGWARSAGRLAHRLGVVRAVRALQSLVAEAPAVIGWLRPVILVPAAVQPGARPGALR